MFHGKIARYTTTFKTIHIFVTSLLGCKFVDIGEPRTLIPTITFRMIYFKWVNKTQDLKDPVICTSRWHRFPQVVVIKIITL